MLIAILIQTNDAWFFAIVLEEASVPEANNF